MADKPNTYEVVTDRIIAAMEAGTVPWRTPWMAHGGPTSLSSGKAYRGINHLILFLVASSKGYASPLWGTFKQAQALGGHVRKGERGCPVILWKPVERVNKDGEAERALIVRHFTVFNLDQTEGVEVPERMMPVDREPVEVLDGVARALAYPGGPRVRHMPGDKAYYSPLADEITLPALDQFPTPGRYAATALHEVMHSTGHASRLDRLEAGATFGCESYAREELIAEVGAAMLATSLGIEPDWDQSAAYLSSWLRVLKDDRKLIVSAAQAAQKGIDLVMADAKADAEADADLVAA